MPQQQPQSTSQLVGSIPDVTPLFAASKQTDSRFINATMTAFPASQALLAKSKLPFGLLIAPNLPGGGGRDAAAVPLISGPIIRCRSCRTYLNPWIEWFDQGTRYRCNICGLANAIPADYDYDFRTKAMRPRSSHSELQSAVVEFEASDEYMVRAPQPPIYLFLIETSAVAVQSGMLSVVASTILRSLDAIPNHNDRSRVGFLTFDSALHFYAFPEEEEAAADSGDGVQCLVVKDFDAAYLPCPVDQLVVSLQRRRPAIERFLAAFPAACSASSSSAGNCFGSALRFATEMLLTSGGKIVAFQCSLPTIGEGALQVRGQEATAAAAAIFTPGNLFYKNLAIDCTRSQIAIDMFLLPRAGYMDVATLGNVVTYTGGHTFYYPGFDATNTEDVCKLAGDLASHLAAPHGLEAVLRVRASKGIQIDSYFGSFFMRSADLLSLPNVNYQHAYAMQASIEENITAKSVSFQAALLYTTCWGERRIRIVNLCLPVTDSLPELYQSVCQTTLANLLSKIALEKAAAAGKLEAARDFLTGKCSELISSYKAISGQASLPPSLALLPLLTLGILKSVAFCLSGVSLDERAQGMILMRSASLEASTACFHAYFCLLSHMSEADCEPGADGLCPLLPPLNLTSERLAAFRNGIFLVEDGKAIWLWVGSQAHPALLETLFGAASFGELRGGCSVALRADDSNLFNRKVQALIATLKAIRNMPNPVIYLVKEDSDNALKAAFLAHLIEDRTDNYCSYQQFALQLREKLATK